MVIVDDDGRRDTYTKKYGLQPTLRFRHVPDDFARTLAKIAYCQALTALNPGDFDPLVLPYIMGTKKNLSYIVGSQDGAPEANNGYRLTTGYAQLPDRLILAVEIRLYANTHAPTYQVILGTVMGQSEIARVIVALHSAEDG